MGHVEKVYKVKGTQADEKVVVVEQQDKEPKLLSWPRKETSQTGLTLVSSTVPV